MTSKYLFSSVVVVDVDVFRTLMEDRVFGKLESRLIVALEVDRDGELKLLKSVKVPDSLSSGKGKCHVLSFSRRGSNRLLFL